MAHQLRRARHILRRISYAAAFAIVAAAMTQANTIAATSGRRSAARIAFMPTAATYVYTYDGIVYDRLFAGLTAASYVRNAARRAWSSGLRPPDSRPYAITNLSAVYKGNFGPLTGAPTTVNDSGLITFFDTCQCFSGGDFDNANAGLVIDDEGNQIAPLYWYCCYEGEAISVPYAINSGGYSAGSYTQDTGGNGYTRALSWAPNGGIFNYDSFNDSGDGGSVAYAINDGKIAVGQVVANGTYAAEFNPFSGQYFSLLQPPRNTSWIGSATGISNYGIIVGYGIFKNQTSGRALRFFTDRPAVVVPVGAAGISTSAQAVNVHGDIVGNAGAQAYLYKNGRVTYLPRPPGETAGNAVAYAVNASDEVVGNIYTGPSSSTAFLYSGGKAYDITSLLPAASGWQVYTAVGINDSGQIVGTGNEGSYSMKPLTLKPSAMLRRRF